MMNNPNDDMLDDIFAQARAVAPEPSDALVARVLADAAAASQPVPATPVVRLGLWTRVLDMVGGWPTMGGLAVATIAGVLVGFSPPASVEDFTAAMLGNTVTVGVYADDLDFELGTLIDG